MGYSPASVAQEIHYLSKLTNVPCDQFRHLILAANKTDPPDPAVVSEAHLFVEDGSPQHRAFDQAISRAPYAGKMRRYRECVPEPGMPENLCYIADNRNKGDFEQLANSLGIPFQWGIVPVGAKIVLRYKPDPHLTWLVTYIAARAFNPTTYLNAAADPVANPSLQVGDMRSDDTDWNGFMTGWINVGNTAIFAVDDIPTMALFNKPVLFTFQGGKRVSFVVNRGAASLPGDAFQLQLAVHGYLVQGNALQNISMNTTQLQNKTVP